MHLFSDAAEKLLNTAKEGSPGQVEHATIVLTNSCNADAMCADLFEVRTTLVLLDVYTAATDIDIAGDLLKLETSKYQAIFSFDCS